MSDSPFKAVPASLFQAVSHFLVFSFSLFDLSSPPYYRERLKKIFRRCIAHPTDTTGNPIPGFGTGPGCVVGFIKQLRRI